jgi:hypothetical protein
MKNKIAILSALTLLSGSMNSNAASFIISNVVNGIGDTLYADASNNLMNGGIVTIGYFSAVIDVTDIDTIPELYAQLSNFTTVTSLAPGSYSTTLDGLYAGYAEQSEATSAGNITVGNALLGRSIYSIITNASSLAAATAASQFALVLIGTIADDNPVENTYSANPVNAPIIGSIGSYTGNASGLGTVEDTYVTLKMSAVPEPSAALLGAFGVLGLLRRRRI